MPNASSTRAKSANRRARAKLNLYLHIVGRRPNGFHELQSLVAFADVADTIAVSSAADLGLTVEGPFAVAMSDTPAGQNLVMRAAQSLQAWAAERGHAIQGARIMLKKALPVASGIGGGSADAAATLLALSELWNLPIGNAELAEVGLTLGSDLPVCLRGAPVLMTGIGEILTTIPGLPVMAVVLVNPGVPLPTPPVYRAFAERTPNIVPGFGTAPVGPWSTTEAMIADLTGTRNDLEPAAISLCPAISNVLVALRAAPGCRLARMSGSGATCFGLFFARSEADLAADAIRATQPDWWVESAELASLGEGRAT